MDTYACVRAFFRACVRACGVVGSDLGQKFPSYDSSCPSVLPLPRELHEHGELVKYFVGFVVE